MQVKDSQRWPSLTMAHLSTSLPFCSATNKNEKRIGEAHLSYYAIAYNRVETMYQFNVISCVIAVHQFP